MIAESLASIVVPLDSVVAYPGNPRQGDIGAISESLKRFGQKKPIVVQASTRYIVAGNHLAQAARALGWTSVAAVVQEMSDEDALAYLLADNRTADLGSYDQAVLAALVSQMAREDSLVGTGFDGDDADALVASLQPFLPTPGDASTESSQVVIWGIIIECTDEAEQVRLLEVLIEAGHRARELQRATSAASGGFRARTGATGGPAPENIATDLRGLVVPIASVTPYPENPRKGDVPAIAASLRRFGQNKPIVVQASTRYVVAGNHLLRAAKALGWKNVAAVVEEMTDSEARAYLLADNRTADLGTYDDEALDALLARASEADGLIGTGYDVTGTDALLAERQWGAIIECADEADQVRLLEQFIGEGRTVRALMS